MSSVVNLEVTKQFCYFDRDFLCGEAAALKQIQDALVAPIAKAEFRGGGRRGSWDGKEHLVKYYGDAIGFPIGLTPRVAKMLNELGFDVSYTDTRPPAPRLKSPVSYVGDMLRYYQTDAVGAAIRNRGVMTGRGVIVMPVRSGKTKTVESIISLLNCPSLFLVPSRGLLGQTYRSFCRDLEGVEIGICGDGKWQPGDVTVSTVQTLVARPVEAIQLIKKMGLIVGDEGHHFRGEVWRKLMLTSQVRYQLIVTGTAWFNPDEPQEEDMIWLQAATGPVLYRIGMSRLIAEGYLKRPIILIYTVEDTVSGGGKGSWNAWYDRAIVNNPVRNAAIASLAQDATRYHLRVLVDTGRHEQMWAIQKMLTARGVACEAIHGKLSTTTRDRLMERFSKGDIQVLVGTVLGEGIDIPELEVVINAEGGKSKVAAIQRLRNLTVCEGKGEVVVIDFYDRIGAKLEEHSMERLVIYNSIRGFEIHEVPWKPGAKYVIPDDIAARLPQPWTEI